MRENVLRELASRAAKDPEFLRRAREGLESTLAQYRYHLTGDELRLVKVFQRQTARLLAFREQREGGFANRRPVPQEHEVRPALPTSSSGVP